MELSSNWLKVILYSIHGSAIITWFSHPSNDQSMKISFNPYYGSTMLTQFGKTWKIDSLIAKILKSLTFKTTSHISNKALLTCLPTLPSQPPCGRKSTLLDVRVTAPVPSPTPVVSPLTYANTKTKIAKSNSLKELLNNSLYSDHKSYFLTLYPL